MKDSNVKNWLFEEMQSAKFKIVFTAIATYTYITRNEGKIKLWNHERYQMNIAVTFLSSPFLGNSIFDE